MNEEEEVNEIKNDQIDPDDSKAVYAEYHEILRDENGVNHNPRFLSLENRFRRVLDDDDIADARQVLGIKALVTHKHHFCSADNRAGWLYKVHKNHLITETRKKVRRLGLDTHNIIDQVDLEIWVEDPTFSRQSTRVKCLKKCLKQRIGSHPKHTAMYLLKYFDLPPKEIIKLVCSMGNPDDVLKSQMQRAAVLMEILQKQLSEQDTPNKITKRTDDDLLAEAFDYKSSQSVTNAISDTKIFVENCTKNCAGGG